jgi:hypothetical protein
MYSKYKENGNLKIETPEEVKKLFKSYDLIIEEDDPILASSLSIHGYLKNEYLSHGKSAIFSWDSRNKRIGIFPSVCWLNNRKHENGMLLMCSHKHMLYANELEDLNYAINVVKKKIVKLITNDKNKEMEQLLNVLD